MCAKETKMEISRDELTEKLRKLGESFSNVLYEEDETFLQNMKTKNLAGESHGHGRAYRN